MTEINVDTKILESFFLKQLPKVDLKQFYSELAEAFYSHILLNFDTEGRHFGKPWASLSPTTIAQRSRSFRRIKDGSGNYVKNKKTGKVRLRKIKPSWPGKMLSVTSALKNRIEYNVQGDKINFTFGTLYAFYLHFGTSQMPARPLFPRELPEEMYDDIANAYFNALKKVL